MQYVRLGRTGLEVSVAALGAGGRSRLGMSRGGSQGDAANLVRAAVDRGINLIDTAPGYGTEAAVGEGLAGMRDKVVISTKLRVTVAGSGYDSSVFIAPEAIRSSVETSLRALRTERVDILHIHGVRPHQYQFCLDHALPAILRLRELGMVRFMGITESFGVDIDRVVMRKAITDRIWDVLMLGHNFVNASAMKLVLSKASEERPGVMGMYAVRGALTNAERLTALLTQLAENDEIDAEDLDRRDPLGFLLADGVASSFVQAAYRFSRHTPGIDVVLTGTGNSAHLDENIEAILDGPLPDKVLRRLEAIFRRVRTATGD